MTKESYEKLLATADWKWKEARPGMFCVNSVKSGTSHLI